MVPGPAARRVPPRPRCRSPRHRAPARTARSRAGRRAGPGDPESTTPNTPLRRCAARPVGAATSCLGATPLRVPGRAGHATSGARGPRAMATGCWPRRRARPALITGVLGVPTANSPGRGRPGPPGTRYPYSRATMDLSPYSHGVRWVNGCNRYVLILRLRWTGHTLLFRGNTGCAGGCGRSAATAASGETSSRAGDPHR